MSHAFRWVTRTNIKSSTLDFSVSIAFYQARLCFCLEHLHCPTNNNFFELLMKSVVW